MEQADGGGAWLEEAAARCTGGRRRRRGAPAGGEAVRRVEERRHALQSANPKTLYARKAAKAHLATPYSSQAWRERRPKPSLAWTPRRRHNNLGLPPIGQIFTHALSPPSPYTRIHPP